MERTGKISFVIPIGRFSYFVHACLQNVFETCGDPNALDFVFLTAQTIPDEISAAFELASRTFQFRVITAPYDPSPDHLRLLDWAMRHADLTDWVIVQHCDVFWREHNWLPRVRHQLNNSLVVVCPHAFSGYRFLSSLDLCERDIPLVGDTFGVYRRRELAERNLFFRWGTLGTTVPVSEKVAEAVVRGRIRTAKGAPVEFDHQYMDGSQAMSWELAVRSPTAVRFIRPPPRYEHLWSFFRIADTIRRDGTVLRCEAAAYMLGSLPYYSYLTSFCIERSEVESVALPWIWFHRLAPLYGISTMAAARIGDWLRGYSTARRVIGLDSLGFDQFIMNEVQVASRLVKVI